MGTLVGSPLSNVSKAIIIMRILTVVQVFLFALFLFIPSIGVMLFAGFVLKSSFWFAALGLPALIINSLAMFVQPAKSLIALKLIKMGRPESAHPADGASRAGLR